MESICDFLPFKSEMNIHSFPFFENSIRNVKVKLKCVLK